MPYTPILNIAQLLQGTLYLIDHTDYPHKGHPAIEHVRTALQNAISAISEIEALQADATERHLKAVMPSDNPSREQNP
jgi:hypothetical protein